MPNTTERVDRIIVYTTLFLCALLLCGVLWQADIIRRQKEVIRLVWKDYTGCMINGNH